MFLRPILCFFAVFFFSYSAVAQDVNPNIAQNINNIQNDLNAVRKQQVQLSSQLQSETQDRRRIQGEVEVLGNRIRLIENRFDSLISALDLRLQEIEDNLLEVLQQQSHAIQQPTLPEATDDTTSTNITNIDIADTLQKAQNAADDIAEQKPTENTAILQQTSDIQPAETAQNLGVLTLDKDGNAIGATLQKQPTFEDRYNLAIQKIRTSNYSEARATLEQLNSEQADHPLSSNILYWLGETYYVEQDFKRAISKFALSAKNFPEGAKYLDSLLKIGLSLGNTDQTDRACKILNSMKNDGDNFPSDIALTRNNALARFNCGG